MKEFLKQTAEHYFEAMQAGIFPSSDKACFIFPNRRSLVFFQKHFCECAKQGEHPVFAPGMKTINQFFYEVTGADTTDRVSLLLELYDIYKKLNPVAESLDEFIVWGDVILSDFNDVDKYLVNSKQLFANIADLKAIEDNFEYLTDNQREAIEHFIAHFRAMDKNGSDVKKVFVQLWNIMYPLYKQFNEVLAKKGLAYEGMVYRHLAENLEELLPNLKSEKYVFVGLNALNECEKSVLRKMRDSEVAEFCWDFSGELIQSKLNKASFFLSSNIKEFPQAFQMEDQGKKTPDIHIVSVPSSIGQAKQLPAIFKSIDGYEKGTDIAVVLPDETLLMPVLNTIPEEIKAINVTMGYPMKSSSFYSFMEDIDTMQVHMRKRQEEWMFYHKQVHSIFSNSVFKAALNAMDDENHTGAEIVKSILETGKYYIPQSDFRGCPLLELIFRPVVTDLKSVDLIENIAEWQQDTISALAPALKQDQVMALEIEFAREFYKQISFLRSKGMKVLAVTWFRLLEQLVGPVTVPFIGEPLSGLQIMGPLEIRALDFKNLVILSCNEGMFPRRSWSSSLIPSELRKGFDLPTYEYQDAVWSYYFYRMISRAENVWLVYDSRTGGLNTGEESRYIKQLRYLTNCRLEESVAKADIKLPEEEKGIEKTQEHLDILKNKCMSASAIQNYLRCQAKFFYSMVEGLEQTTEVAEYLDNSTLGTVYHDTMRALYYGPEEMMSEEDFDKRHDGTDSGMPEVTKDYLEEWAKREKDIRHKVISLIKLKLKTFEVTGRDLVVANIIVRYVLKTIARDIELMNRRGVKTFKIVGLEKKMFTKIGGMDFIGYIDRLDSFADGELRVVDYKTGKDNPDNLNIDDSKAATIVGHIFGDDRNKFNDYKAALQFYIYDKLLQNAPEYRGKTIYNSMYSMRGIFKEAPEKYAASPEFCKLMDEKIQNLHDEIFDLDKPFSRTENVDDCTFCDFKIICGRKEKGR